MADNVTAMAKEHTENLTTEERMANCKLHYQLLKAEMELAKQQTEITTSRDHHGLTIAEQRNQLSNGYDIYNNIDVFDVISHIRQDGIVAADPILNSERLPLYIT